MPARRRPPALAVVPMIPKEGGRFSPEGGEQPIALKAARAGWLTAAPFACPPMPSTCLLAPGVCILVNISRKSAGMT